MKVRCIDMEIPHQLSIRSDAELLRLAVAGEEQAFLLLYGKLKTGIFRYAFYMTGSKANAEEVTQEVFITLLRESHNYRQDRGDLAAFAFGVARNFVRRIERRERPYAALPEDTALATLSAKLISESDALPAQMICTVDSDRGAKPPRPARARRVHRVAHFPAEFRPACASAQSSFASGLIQRKYNRSERTTSSVWQVPE
jgi:Sigma-70 region 2